MEFLEHKLPNGLEVVAECSGDAYTTALGFFVKTGARDENHEHAGNPMYELLHEHPLKVLAG